jgi:hypothetical protein
MVQRAASGAGIEHQAQEGDHPWLHLHLRRYQPIDRLHQFQAPRKVGNDRQVIDPTHRDRLWTCSLPFKRYRHRFSPH